MLLCYKVISILYHWVILNFNDFYLLHVMTRFLRENLQKNYKKYEKNTKITKNKKRKKRKCSIL